MRASFSLKAERIERAHVLVGVHAHAFVLGAGHAHAQVGEDHELLRRTQLREALLEQRRTVVRAEARAGFEHRRAVGLLSPGAGARCARRRQRDEGAHLFALDHHVLVVRREAAALEPGAAPQLREQRHELAEVRGPFDRPGAEAELFGHRVVVDRRVTAVLLVGQHLLGAAQRTADRKRSVEAHGILQHPIHQSRSCTKPGDTRGIVASGRPGSSTSRAVAVAPYN